MELSALVDRAVPPTPWAEGDKIPWNDPDFSRRMLAVHLNQENDWGSRRGALIDTHVKWIDKHFLGPNSRILDLCCGPGLYLERLAARGHRSMGIDFSPASIYYAREKAPKTGVEIQYRLEDVRTADFGAGFDLVMMLFGEFNVFRTDDASAILHRAFKALKPGGHVLIEAHLEREVKRQGETSPFWQACDSGLFGNSPHLLLEEHFWEPSFHTTTSRYWKIDMRDGSLSRYASTTQAYSPKGYGKLFREAGFTDICRYLDMGETLSIFKDKLTVYSGLKT